MSKFFTGTGDGSTSSLLGKERVPKHHPQLEAVGAIDEANAALGVVRAHLDDEVLSDIILTIQRDLYHIMSEVAATPENADQFRKIDQTRILWLESQVEKLGDKVQMPKEFIVPGDNIPGAYIDLARTIVRRAERRTSVLFHGSDLKNEMIIPYLNRLSTFCFFLELAVLIMNSNSISLAKTNNP